MNEPLLDLRLALEHMLWNLNLLLSGKPVRDVAETIAEVERALSQQPTLEAALKVERLELTDEQRKGLTTNLVSSLPGAVQRPAIDMRAHLERQRDWSERTFGPGSRAKGVVAHIRKELIEIENDPSDLMEWIDVVILALDGAWRAGGTAEEIIGALVAKQTKNEGRVWPDWRTMSPDQAIEHDRTAETQRFRHADGSGEKREVGKPESL